MKTSKFSHKEQKRLVLEGRERSFETVAEENGISKFTLYSWGKKFQNELPQKRSKAADPASRVQAFILRLDRKLHAQLKKQAHKDGVTLNAFIKGILLGWSKKENR